MTREDQDTKEQIKAAIEVTKAVAAVVRELGSVPAGKLYLVVMGQMSLEEFEGALRTLERTALIERTQCGMLKWIGN